MLKVIGKSLLENTNKSQCLKPEVLVFCISIRNQLAYFGKKTHSCVIKQMFATLVLINIGLKSSDFAGSIGTVRYFCNRDTTKFMLFSSAVANTPHAYMLQESV